MATPHRKKVVSTLMPGTKDNTELEDFAKRLQPLKSFLHKYLTDLSEVQEEVQRVISSLFGNLQITTGFTDHEKFPHLLTTFARANGSTKPFMNIFTCLDHWMSLLPFPSLNLRQKKTTSDVGRSLAAALFLIGDPYNAMRVLRTLVRLDSDILSRQLLMRWSARLSEWEILEDHLKYEDGLSLSTKVDHVEETRNVAECIASFHRNPALRDAKGLELREKNLALDKSEKSFHVYETQLLILSFLYVTPRAAKANEEEGDTLGYLESALNRAETLVKSRLPCFGHDKVMDGLMTKAASSSDMLKACSSICEYYEVTRQCIYEYYRCGMVKEASTYLATVLCTAFRLCIPRWITQGLSLLLMCKRESAQESSDIPFIKKMIEALYMDPIDNDGEKGGKSQPSCISQLSMCAAIVRQSSTAHFPRSDCSCHLCGEASRNWSLRLESLCLKSIYLQFSPETLSQMISHFTLIRQQVAPCQLSLMGIQGKTAKPRPPVFLVESFVNIVCCALLSSNGLCDESLKEEAITMALKACSYASQSFVPYRLILRQMQRKDLVTEKVLPWMEKKGMKGSIKTMLANMTISTECRTPRNGKDSKMKESNVKIAWNEAINDWDDYSHLLYRQWKYPLCSLLGKYAKDDWSRAMFLSETVALSTRQARRTYHKNVAETAFKTSAHFEEMVRRIPDEMTVVQLLVTSEKDLVLVKLHSDRSPIVVPLAKAIKWEYAFEALNKALKKNEETAEAGKKLSDAVKYWEGRREAEEMMKMTVEAIERDVLGAFCPLCIPSLKLTSYGERAVESIIVKDGQGRMTAERGREMLSIAYQTSSIAYKCLVESMAVLENWSKKQIDLLIALKKRRLNWDNLFMKTDSRFVFLVLSPELSRCPWEKMSCLDTSNFLSSRLVSLHQLFSLLQSKIPHYADPMKSYYILDPANDLASTKERLTPVVEKHPWKGLVGEAPERDRVGSILQENDFFFYLGHGNGLRYLSRSVIRKTDCNAVVLLMGCSSAQTLVEGPGLDGKGAVLDYAVGKCPCLVGCLFMVTDGEIDKYFMALVDGGIGKESTGDCSTSSITNHLEAMKRAREKVRLPYLTGASVVSYGIPVSMR